MQNEAGANPTVANCILWGNAPDQITTFGSLEANVTYSDVQGGHAGEGNIDADPLFVDAANGDYHLQASSPCIDAGDNSAIPAGVIVDLDGNPCIINSIVDMGAYEAGEEVSGVKDVEDFETGDFSKFQWEHYGDRNWAVTSRQKHSGTYSAEAGSIGDDEYTTLEVTRDCVSGDISFYCKVSSESSFDYLEFYIDGVKQDEWSGEQDWAQVSFGVTAGTRTFKWTYSKDDSNSQGSDTAWIDDVVFPTPIGPYPPPPTGLIELTDATFDQIVLGSDVPVLVFFYADWCPYSRMMDPIIQEIADEYAGKAKICKLNIDDAPATKAEFGVSAVPTFILFKDGQVQRKWIGVTSKGDLTVAIDELLLGVIDTTEEFIVVDDFESYNDLDPDEPDSNRIFYTWIDGYKKPTNGSVVGYDNAPFCEVTIVHGGKQSMPFFYSNTGGAAYSEAECTFTFRKNWTRAGVKILVLYFYGTAGNTGQLYVKVDGRKVVYNGDAADITKPRWMQWNIELASLGIDLRSVRKLAIGIDGTRASGTLYFDDIGLYRTAPAMGADIIIMAGESCRTSILKPVTNDHSSRKLSIRSDQKSAKSWIKFDISELDVGDLETATLTVALHQKKAGDRHFDVSYVNDDCLYNIGWYERSITWNNAPGNNTANLSSLDTGKTTLLTTVNFTDGVPGDSFTIDVLEALEADTDGIVQFVFHNSNGLLNLATHDHPEETWRPFIHATEGAKD
jgi:thioredoxin